MMVGTASQVVETCPDEQDVKLLSSQVTRVRNANTEQDVDAIMPLAIEMHHEDRHRNLKLDQEKLRRFFLKAIDIKYPSSLLVAERSGRTTGFLYATIGETFFGPSKVASCMGLYVMPKSRGSLAALKLIKAYQIWAKKHGAEQTSIHVTSGVRMSQTDRLFRKLGFEVSGGNYFLKDD